MPLGPEAVEHHLGALAVRVEGGTVELPAVELGIVGIELRRVHAARGDRDHSRGSGGAQRRQQQAGEQERPEDVGREGALEPRGGALPPLREDAGVVDEQVERRLTCQELLGEETDPGRIRDVAELGDEPLTGAQQAGLDPGDGPSGPLFVAAEQVHGRAGPQQALAGRLADSRAAPGDQGCSSAQVARDRVLVTQAAQREPQPRVARQRR